MVNTHHLGNIAEDLNSPNTITGNTPHLRKTIQNVKGTESIEYNSCDDELNRDEIMAALREPSAESIANTHNMVMGTRYHLGDNKQVA